MAVTRAEEKRMSIGSGLFTLIAGVGLLGYAGWNAYLESSAASWPTTSARIVTSRVEEDSDTWRADIVFEYSVDGKTHRSTELWFGSAPAGYRESMQELVAKYPKGTTIAVYYNPQDPSQAVADPRRNATLTKWTIGFAFAAVLLGGYFLSSGLTLKPDEAYEEGGFLFGPDEASKPSPKREAETIAITWVPQPVSKAEAAPPAKPKGPRHWAVRAIAGVIGLPVLLLFGPVTIIVLQKGLEPQAAHPLPVTIISTGICAGIALFGLWLTFICFTRGGKQQTLTAS